MVAGYPSDKEKRLHCIGTQLRTSLKTARLHYWNTEQSRRKEELVTFAGQQTQEIRYHRAWVLFLPKAELFLGQQIKMNTQFLAANSAGHSCSIPSAQPSRVNTEAVASHPHESSSITVPQQQPQGVLCERRASQLCSPVTLSLCDCAISDIRSITLGTGHTLRGRACSYLIDFRLLSIASGGMKLVAT